MRAFHFFYAITLFLASYIPINGNLSTAEAPIIDGVSECWTDGFFFATCCCDDVTDGTASCWGGGFTFERCCLQSPLLSALDVQHFDAPIDCGCDDIALATVHDNWGCAVRTAKHDNAHPKRILIALIPEMLASCPFAMLSVLSEIAERKVHAGAAVLLRIPEFLWVREWLIRSGRSLFAIAAAQWRVFPHLAAMHTQLQKTFMPSGDLEPDIPCKNLMPPAMTSAGATIRDMAYSADHKTRSTYLNELLAHPPFAHTKIPRMCLYAYTASAFLKILEIRWRHPDTLFKSHLAAVKTQAEETAYATLGHDILPVMQSQWPLYALLDALHIRQPLGPHVRGKRGIFSNTTSDVISEGLVEIRRACGALCDESEGSMRPPAKGLPFGTRVAPINCTALFEEELIDASRERGAAPWQIPEKWRDAFTMNGKIKAYRSVVHRDDKLQLSSSKQYWTQEDIDGRIQQWKNRDYSGNSYPQAEVLVSALQAVNLTNKRVLVLGSIKPWIEAGCLALGASSVMTVDYGKVISAHPHVSAFTPDVFRTQFLNGSLREIVDVVVTYSSLEHSGLGRYGDALNPWGDTIALARAWCVAKPKATLVIGVPVSRPGEVHRDRIHFNTHRIYGPTRYPVLATNWQLREVFHEVATLSEPQDLHVFTRLDGP